MICRHLAFAANAHSPLRRFKMLGDPETGERADQEVLATGARADELGSTEAADVPAHLIPDEAPA